MTKPANVLDLFHPVIRAWFAERLGEPTEIQALAWPRVAAGEHALLVAPTGSGKTLAAFLWALDRLLTGAWSPGRVRVLYVSPLKALGNDVRRNLLVPLEEIRARFDAAGEPVADVRVLVRTGDTPAEERARMARRPPEILITTPESLNILLTSRGGRAMLGGVRSVILDEVHAVVGGKRGVQEITAVERLVRLAGEVQRVALSATVEPPETVAAWVGGWERRGEDGWRRRPVTIVRSRTPKRYDLSVRYVAAGSATDDEPVAGDELWARLAAELRRPLRVNRSTLVFANSKRTVEKVARLVNEDEPEPIMVAHHGALSRELRTVVEERLKAGQLRGIVATNSLELGIDIGALDEVVLVQTPPTMAAAAQRVGRAGHQVGATSRARFLPLAPRDLLDAAVVARAVRDGVIETVRPVAGALDVLAQVIVSMTATETWPREELAATLRASEPYHALSDRQLDLVLDMLAGRYRAARVRDLKALVAVDEVDGTVRGRPGAERLVYRAGGTIPDRGYFHLRTAEGGALLGELDEEFVWERKVGDAFTMGVQTWRIERITHNDVLVRPVRGRGAMAPFWRADARDRSFELAERLGAFLEAVEPRLDDASLPATLAAEHDLEPAAARALVGWLAGQRAATAGVLPHRHRLVVERVVDPQRTGGPALLILHTGWGGRVNRPFALALQAAWERRFGGTLEVNHDDDCVSLAPPVDVRPDELLALVPAAEVEELLRASLERSGFFGARFREAAGIALLLPREGFRRRTPLWLSRQRAKVLLEAVREFDDFPLVLEAWRACLADAFDLEALARVLDEVATGRIAVVAATTDRPSPFAAGVTWRRTNELMYEDDTPPGGGPTALRRDLLAEVALSAHLRPRVPRVLAESLGRKLARTYPGYAPRSSPELLEWVKERAVLPVPAWRELLAAVERDSGREALELVAEIAGKIAAVVVPGADGPVFVAAVEALPRVLRALGLARGDVSLWSATLDGAPADAASAAFAGLRGRRPRDDEDEGDPAAELLAEVLRFHGPVPRASLAGLLPLDEPRLADALAGLADAQRVVDGELTEDAPGLEVCDAENLERLLRLARAAARPAFEALPAAAWPSFVAGWQGLGGQHAGVDGLRGALEKLFGFAAPAEAWEAEILPARLEPYVPAWLDALLAEGELAWFGCGTEKLAFALAGDRDLFVGPSRRDEAALAGLLPDGAGRFPFETLLARTGVPSPELARRLWAAAWRGEVSNDGFAAVRRGIETSFAPAEAERSAEPPPAGRGRRLRFGRWQASRPFAGNWFRLAAAEAPLDALDADELDRDRARAVLERYGVVFRELLEREPAALGWGRLFRALRLMELSGEVVAGQFFLGLGGLQFALPSALRRLQDGGGGAGVAWMNAADPASPCGLGLDLGLPLPRRVATSHLVVLGGRVVAVSERRGKALAIAIGPEHPRLPDVLGFLKAMLTRPVRPLRAVRVETINGEPAATGAYREVLASLFHVTRDGGALRLGRRY
ncbi:MAG: DEAD/DEAH box helicase [Acidobacteria bacterium]|nr:DEAD/DEAH box helicase [Acidobacteriota bacterium]